MSGSAYAQTWSEWVLLAPAIAAVALVLAACPMTPDRADITTRMGPVNWDFTKSWASNLTVFGAALGAIVSGGLLPKSASSGETATFVGLNVLFGLAAVVGPFVYTVLQRRVAVTRVNGKSKATEPQYQGTVGGFLLGTAIMLWGVLGVFATVAELLAKIHRAHSLPSALLVALAVLVALAGLLVVAFLVTRIRVIVGEQTRNPAKRRRRFEKRLRLAGIAAEAVDQHRAALPPVPVL